MILCSNCGEMCGQGTIEAGAVVICTKCVMTTQSANNPLNDLALVKAMDQQAANELLAAYARDEQDTYKTVLWLDQQAATQLEWSAKEAQL